MMGLWGLIHVEERGNPDTVYGRKRIVYQVGNKDKIKYPNPFSTLSNNSDVEGQYVKDYVQRVWQVFIPVLSLQRWRRFKENAQRKLFRNPA
jgi:hypothetical protein